MENAHLRMGKLKFVRQTRDTITEVSLHMDHLVAEKPAEKPAEPRSAVQIHLVSVFGGDQELAPSRRPSRMNNDFRSACLAGPSCSGSWVRSR